jgi:hypothetical protein
MELGLVKGLQLAGFEPVVLVPYGGRLFLKYYRLAAVRRVYLWDEFTKPGKYPAEEVIERLGSVQELLTFEYAGARVGRLAVSTTLRGLKAGSINLKASKDRQFLIDRVSAGMASAKAAQKILRKFRPALALFGDHVYTPTGELFDNCLANGIDTIAWHAAHKSNALILKRYTPHNRDTFPNSLAAESWGLVREMKWTEAHRKQLQQELYSNYANGDWYSMAGTQFNKRFMDANEIRKWLKLDPGKKTAFIFPNIPWDATLFWGKTLFRNHEEWLIETVRAAAANEKVNWVIKIHPANAGKKAREGFQQEPAEVAALRDRIGTLPPHISMIPAESEIATFSLFELMDYCLTVCGTVGVEAAMLGIPVLTGGQGLYHGKGFTIDSESCTKYLERVANIQVLQRLTPLQRELAERYAYGVFLLRPLPLIAYLEYQNDLTKFSTRGRINISKKEDWYNSPDLRAFAQWVTDSKQDDFLLPLSK